MFDKNIESSLDISDCVYYNSKYEGKKQKPFEGGNRMDILRSVFPLSFKFSDSVVNLVIGVIVYLVVGVLIGIGIALVSVVPIVGWIVGICGGLVDLYVLAGIVVMFLSFFNVV